MKYELDILFNLINESFSPEIVEETEQEINRIKRVFKMLVPGKKASILQPYFQQAYDDLRDQMNELTTAASNDWALALLSSLVQELEKRY